VLFLFLQAEPVFDVDNLSHGPASQLLLFNEVSK
jgi:hypothetical protein